MYDTIPCIRCTLRLGSLHGSVCRCLLGGGRRKKGARRARSEEVLNIGSAVQREGGGVAESTLGV